MKKLILITTILSANIAHANDLLSIYRLAQMNDPILQAAKQTQLATSEALPQARANLLPLITAAANTQGNSSTVSGSYNSHLYALNLSQPIFNYQAQAQLAQANNTVKQANAAYVDAELSLILRSAQAYFNVLKAEDTLKFTKAQRNAFAKFLDQTEQRFKVGLIAITDVQIAKARHDSALAQEIAAQTELDNQKQALQQIVGQKIEKLSSLRDTAVLPPPDPADIEKWVDAALRNNWGLKASEYAMLAAQKNITVNSSGHLPTLNLIGNASNQKGAPTSLPQEDRTSSIGVQLTVPLFNGGQINSKTRQAMHQYQKASYDSENLYREVESKTRQAYLGVLSQLSQIKALKQAIVSNQSALDATEAAFNVGTRTIVDVLNAQTNLIQAEQNYAIAKYSYIIQSLTLKQAAGILSPEDVQHINSWLKT